MKSHSVVLKSGPWRGAMDCPDDFCEISRRSSTLAGRVLLCEGLRGFACTQLYSPTSKHRGQHDEVCFRSSNAKVRLAPATEATTRTDVLGNDEAVPETSTEQI